MALEHIKDPVLRAELLERLDPDFWRPDKMRRRGARAREEQRSGPCRLTLRLPRRLHDDIATSAARSGSSVNGLIVMMLARAMGEIDGRERR